MGQLLQIDVQKSNPLPIYLQIRDQIRDHIVSTELPPGAPLPDLRTLSEAAGVSPRTMDRALLELIEEGICFRRPKKGTFVGDPTAGLRTVCLLDHPLGALSVTDDLVSAAIYRGIRGRADRAGVDTVFVTEGIASALTAYGRMTGVRLRGVLMMRNENLAEVTALAARAPETRFVCLNYYLAGFEEAPPNVTGVFNDEYGGGREAAAALAAQGHRNLGILSLALSNENYRLRVAGFAAGAAAAGARIVWQHEIHPSTAIGGGQQPDLAAAVAAQLPDGPEAPTAVLCVNDWLAAGLLHGACARGRTLEVTGYDHLMHQLFLAGTFPTVAVDYAAIGFRGMDILMQQDPPAEKVVRLPPALLPETHIKNQLQKGRA